MKRLVVAFALALAVLGSPSARATLVYQYVADISSFTAAPGTSLDVHVYLQETASNGSSSFIAAQGGLLTGAFEVSRVSGDGYVSAITDSATLATDTFGAYGGTATTFGALNSTGNLWRLSETSNSTYDALLRPTNPTSLGTVNGAVTQVLLGTLTLTVGTTNSVLSLGNAKVGLHTSPWQGGAPINLDLDNPAIGYLGASDFTFNIILNAAVPEPSSLTLLTLGFLGASLCRRR